MAFQFFWRDAVVDRLSNSLPIDRFHWVHPTNNVLISQDHADNVYRIETDIRVDPHQMGGLGFKELMR